MSLNTIEKGFRLLSGYLGVLKKRKGNDRSAFFHCVLVLMASETDPTPLICHGVWEGEILPEPRGNKGFGYDPIFYVPTHHCSVAELPTKEKNRISHRGQVMEQLIEAMTDF